MKGGKLALLVILAILLIGGCSAINLQRKMVGLDENVKNKWGEVQNQYQRRADLVPNLVNTVKGAANFEKSTLEAVTQARANATSLKVDPNDLSPEKIKEFQARQGELSQALGRLLMVTENYPQLKANQNFLSLQDQLEGTENRITVARKSFNDAVQQYNTTTRSFPNNFLSPMLGFHPKGTFEAEPSAQKAPTVQF